MSEAKASPVVVAVRPVRVGSETFELRVEQEPDGRLSATSYGAKGMVMSRRLDGMGLEGPVRQREGQTFKFDVNTEDGQAAVTGLLDNLERDFREYHAAGHIA